MLDRLHRSPVLPALALVVTLLAASGAQGSTTWSGLRGPTYDGAVRDAQLFEGDGVELSIGWKRDLGSGYSVVSVDSSRLIAAFQAGPDDVVAAFDLEHGDELWRQPIGEAYAGHTGSHDGPIATPVLHEGRVYGLGPRGDLFALDAGTGEALWQLNLTEMLEAEAPYYGFTSTPLIAGGVLIVQIGAGEGRAFGGFDPGNGELLWTTGTDDIEYQSPIVAEIAGERQVLVVGIKTLSALDPKTGEVLWLYEHAGDERAMGGATIVPVPAGEGRILLMNNFTTSVMLRITKADSYDVEELWTAGSIKTSYVVPVYHEGHLYGMNSKIFTCVDAATGETVWRSRKAGDGFPTLVGDHLLIMNKPGTLRVAKATPAGYEEVAALELFDEHSWSAPAYAGGHIYVRSMSELARIDLDSAAGAASGGESRVAATGFSQFLADVEEAEDKAAVIDAFLAQQSSFPIIEDSGAVHFVYRGPASDVGIVGDMIGYRREDPMIQVSGTDLFYYSTLLEPDAAIGYGFIVDFEDPSADPLNPEPHEGLFGDVSWFAMPAWRAPEFLAEAESAAQGTTVKLEWESTVREGQAREATVYLPAGYESSGKRRYPTLYFLAGHDALEKGALKNTLDNLIGSRVEPVIGVFVLPNAEEPESDGQQIEQYIEMVAKELVPLVDESYLTAGEPAGRAVAGVGRAADAALMSALSHPDIFGRVGSLWPSVFGPDIATALTGAESPLVIFHAWGTYHMRSPHEAWDLVVENRKLFEQLREAGYRPAGGEVPEGMGWTMYRGYSDDMLGALFPLR